MVVNSTATPTLTPTIIPTDVLHWVLSDHLGSTSTTANQDGSFSSTIQYTAFGEIRVTKNTTLTKYRYTGQLAQAELGLDYYVARWYDPVIGHFTQADTIIPEPGKASAFDRYAYVLNNPIKLVDPSGHSDMGDCGPGENCDKKVMEENEKEKEKDKKKLMSKHPIMQFLEERGYGAYFSVDISIGGIGLDNQMTYYNISIDDVRYKDKEAIFVSTKIPNPATKSTLPLYHPLAEKGPSRDRLAETPHKIWGDDDDEGLPQQGASPQISITILAGILNGTELEKQGVTAYKGPFTHSGGTFLFLAGDYFQSNNPYTGALTTDVTGYGGGLTFGLPPASVQHIVTNSEVIIPPFESIFK